MTHRSESQATWFKSSYSQDNGTACLEIANLHPTARVAIRDSKTPDGSIVTIPSAAFTAFVRSVAAAPVPE